MTMVGYIREISVCWMRTATFISMLRIMLIYLEDITGRIKELIITAGGENIPPVLIEDEIKKEVGSVVSNVMVIGDRKKFLSCVFTLKTKPATDPKPSNAFILLISVNR